MKNNLAKKIGVIVLLIIGIVFLIRNLHFQTVEDYNQETKQIEEDLGLREVASGSATGEAVTDVTKTTTPKQTDKKTEKPKATPASTVSATPKKKGPKVKVSKAPNNRIKVEPTNTPVATKHSNSTSVPTKAPQVDSSAKQIRCTLEIRCDDLVKHMDRLDSKVKKYVPQSGVILKKVEVMVQDGDTVYDILSRVCRSQKIALDAEYTMLYETYYIKGIANLYEFAGGDMSGWTYCVNGEYPQVGASAYKVKNGDAIQWLYTCGDE